jgi:hypothetical protein
MGSENKDEKMPRREWLPKIVSLITQEPPGRVQLHRAAFRPKLVANLERTEPMRKLLGKWGGNCDANPLATTLFLLICAAFFLALPDAANAQIWVTSGFIVTPATPVGVSGITFTPGSQNETAFCSTSAINPATGLPSPAAADYDAFIASCTLTPTAGTTIISTSCPSGSGLHSGNPSIQCYTEFVPQPNVTYTVTSSHALLFNHAPSGTVCGQPNYNWFGDQFCWSDPLGYWSLIPDPAYPWPPIPNYPGASSNVSSLAINTVDVTCGAIGTCAPQYVPYEYCLSGSGPFCSNALVTPSRWWMARTSEPWQVKCSDIVQGSVTPVVNGPTITATFTPNFGYTLAQAEQVCVFTDFNWQQTITSLPSPFPSQFWEVGSNVPPQTPFNDPPPNGYIYQQGTLAGHNLYPVYFDMFTSGNDWSLDSWEQVNTLGFRDTPKDSCLPGGKGIGCNGQTAPAGSVIRFITHLVGVTANSSGVSIVDTGIGFNWETNFNGTSGGVSKLNNTDPPDSGSGTGGVTVTAYSGTSAASSLPTLLTGNQEISTTASGLAYSRVSKTFNGTITITNDSDSTITGPIEVDLDSLTSGVTLSNATGTFGGWPYIVIPNTASLSPGQSASARVQFSNPGNAIINFVPMIYSGVIE